MNNNFTKGLNRLNKLLIFFISFIFLYSCTGGGSTIRYQGDYQLRSLEADTEISAILISINRELRLAYEYYLKGDFKKALRVYKKAARSYMKFDYRHRLATVYSNIGTIFLKTNQLDLAEQYLKESADLSDKFILSPVVRQRIKAVTLYKLAKINLFRNKLKLSKKLNDKSFSINESINNTTGYSKNFRVYGMYFYRKKNDKIALKYFRDAISGNLSNLDYYDLILNRMSVGDIYLEQKKYKQALRYYNRALYVAKKREYNEKINQILFKLAVLFETKGKKKNALSYYKRAYETALNLETTNEIRQIREKRAFDKITQIYLKLKKPKMLNEYKKKIDFFFYTRVED